MFEIGDISTGLVNIGGKYEPISNKDMLDIICEYFVRESIYGHELFSNVPTQPGVELSMTCVVHEVGPVSFNKFIKERYSIPNLSYQIGRLWNEIKPEEWRFPVRSLDFFVEDYTQDIEYHIYIPLIGEENIFLKIKSEIENKDFINDMKTWRILAKNKPKDISNIIKRLVYEGMVKGLKQLLNEASKIHKSHL